MTKYSPNTNDFFFKSAFQRAIFVAKGTGNHMGPWAWFWTDQSDFEKLQHVTSREKWVGQCCNFPCNWFILRVRCGEKVVFCSLELKYLLACNLQDVEGLEPWIVRLLQWYSTVSDDLLRSVLHVWQDGRGGRRWLSDVWYYNLRSLSKPVVCHANPRQDPWTERNRRLVCERSSLELLLSSVHVGPGCAGGRSESAVWKFHGKVVTWRFRQD